jgi:hypothetical protein
MPGKLFISHSSQDDDLVRRLRRALADLGQDGWIDSRELRGGDPLWPEIEAAISASAGLAVIVSINGLQSKWLGKELKHALKLQAERGADRFPVIPLAVDGCKLGVLEEFFDAEPRFIPISSDAGGIDAALHDILVALRRRDPSDPTPTLQPTAALMEELVLELSRLSIHLADGKRRARGSARLVYEPADPNRREVRSPKSWVFEAPLGPIEVEELRWYLETYAVWPSRFDDARVKKIEANLVTWGRLLHDAAMPADKAASVLQAWAQVGDGAARRFSVHVEPELDDGTPEADVLAAREAATLLLGLPWELLHDGRGFLFQGGRPVRVRRRLPNTHAVEPPVLATPIRIVLVSPRPEDDGLQLHRPPRQQPAAGPGDGATRRGGASDAAGHADAFCAARGAAARQGGRAAVPRAALRWPRHLQPAGGPGWPVLRAPRRGWRADRQAPPPHRLHRHARPAAARPRHRAGVPGSLPERAGRAGE